MKRRVLLLAAGAALLSACRSQTPPEASAPPTAAIMQWSGQQGGSERPSTQVLRTPAEWTEFWRTVRREPPRALDPAREMAVVIHLGGKRTGGFTAEVVRTRVEDGTFVVQFRTTAPEPGMMVTQELTNPWATAIVPRSTLPVVFQDPAARPPARREK